MNRGFLAITLIAVLTACVEAPSKAESIQPDDVTNVGAWGQASEVMQLKHLYFAGQPDEAGLRQAKEAGVGLVINMRTLEEIDPQQKMTAESLGMDYHVVPIARSGQSFSPEAMAKISQLVEAADHQPVLLHCGSGNRAAGWLAVHLAKDHEMGVDQAVAVAEAAGLRPGMAKRARAFLE